MEAEHEHAGNLGTRCLGRAGGVRLLGRETNRRERVGRSVIVCIVAKVIAALTIALVIASAIEWRTAERG